MTYTYDERIDEYNWYFLFGFQMGLYFMMLFAVKKWVPEPGPKKVFEERGKMQEYHFYYF